ncbi:MAG: MFS transporter [Gammaproteobacteria bacterium]|nr:MFS transporter [Gammaproteobacteria bacterium]
MNNSEKSIWQNNQFKSYLGSTAFSGIAYAMQYLLISWLLIGVLLLPADRVGVIQAIMGIPGIFLMLWGGASADRTDPRSLLVRVYAVAPVLPLFLLVVDQGQWLNVWTVALWGLGMSVITSFSSPAHQAILNRVSGADLQKGVAASTAVMFLVQMIGLGMAGQMDRFGLSAVLVIQGVCLVMGAVMIRRLTAQVPVSAPPESALRVIVEGFRATYRDRVIFDVLVVNFISSIFNAGAFMTVFPFIIKRIYDGDAMLLAIMMIVFYGGAMLSNLMMLRFMPFVQPGRLFLWLQLSRIIIVFLLWIEPGWWLLVLTIIAWGINMGVTSTIARTIVQESAEAAFRGRILSVFNLGLLGSAPIGALLLGWIIESFGTLNALIPSMIVSLVLFIYGVYFTGVWDYRSPTT